MHRRSIPNVFAGLTETLLMGPGPSCVPPAVYEALSRPTIGHLDARFIAIMDQIELHDIEIGAGLGTLAGRVWRIGLMGHTARSENVDRL